MVLIMRATIKDVAAHAGVSVTTVAKALADKPKISKDTKEAVLLAASEIGYVPNKSAMAMARNPIRIGVLYSRIPPEFYTYFEQGVRREAVELSDYRVETIVHTFENLNSVDEVKKAIKSFCDSNVNGAVLEISPNMKDFEPEFELLKKKNIPVLMINGEYRNGGSDNSGNGSAEAGKAGYRDGGDGNGNGNGDGNIIGNIRLNAAVAGAMAAQFLSLCLPAGSEVVIFTGNSIYKVHSGCIESFERWCAGHSLVFRGFFDTYDDREIAYYLTKRVLRDLPDIRGIYVSSYNSVGVCQYLEDAGLAGQVKVVGQDLYPALADKLASNSLTATLFQNQYEYGRQSVRYLYEHLAGIRKKEDCSRDVTPRLVLLSNLPAYAEYF